MEESGKGKDKEHFCTITLVTGQLFHFKGGFSDSALLRSEQRVLNV